MQQKTSIIPAKVEIAKIQAPHQLDRKAICVFAAIGFFLDDNTYYIDQKALPAASLLEFDKENKLISKKRWFNWHYTPRKISFDQALKEYSALFEAVIEEQVSNKQVILPLSGGLDSRTQAVALKRLGAKVNSYSYEYLNGYPETRIAEEIANVCNFPFEKFSISSGYLWDKLDQLVEFNKCQTDLTLPRQMAFKNELGKLGEIFSLGHWGDVLFDNMGLGELSVDEERDILISKLLKRGGFKFAQDLWEAWGLDGKFNDYFVERIHSLLDKIEIKDSNAKLRAFKSLYWAPRWTSANLEIFRSTKPISLPYYDDRICQFICTLPEKYLGGRLLQIEYIKKYAPELAKITWQDARPFNLLNYNKNKFPHNLPSRIRNKGIRLINKSMGKPYIQRNWELQFLGSKNDSKLKEHLFEIKLETLVPDYLVRNVYDSFKDNPLEYSHAVNMLLVLSKFNEKLRDD